MVPLRDRMQRELRSEDCDRLPNPSFGDIGQVNHRKVQTGAPNARRGFSADKHMPCRLRLEGETVVVADTDNADALMGARHTVGSTVADPLPGAAGMDFDQAALQRHGLLQQSESDAGHIAHGMGSEPGMDPSGGDSYALQLAKNCLELCHLILGTGGVGKMRSDAS